MVARTQVFGPRSRVTVDINEQQAQRVFVRFADTDAKKRATKVLGVAIAESPVGKTGDLRAGLRMEQSRDVHGRWSTGYDVISTAAHTMFVIKGTAAHTITGNPLLAFFWPKVGKFVVFHSVHHPGTRPNNFLSRALRAAR